MGTTGTVAPEPAATTPGAPGSAGMNGTTGNDTTGAATGSTPMNTQMPAQMGSLNDGQILAIVGDANKGEIACAKLALTHSKNAEVKKFAQEMIRDHMKLNKDGAQAAQRAGIKAEESDASRNLEMQNDDTSKKLAALHGDAFDKAYADAQVDAHTTVLATLDNQLIPAAANPGFKTALTAARSVVAEHLEHARHLQTMIGNAQGTTSAPSPSTGAVPGSTQTPQPVP
jgi:putative membrane protein